MAAIGARAGIKGRWCDRRGTVALVVLAWGLLAWMALDMSGPLARLVMPATASWTLAAGLAVWTMWAVMMAAMMLPSALPMVSAFAEVSARNREPARTRAFVAAYLLVWSLFSTFAAVLQWALQAAGWTNPMIESTSAPLSAALLLIAGAYQFSPLKRLCLSRCRTPMGFLLGAWRPGLAGAWRMGLRHGLSCLGCCWALMALLFAGGAMNLAWVVALALLVAVEKLLPRGEFLARLLGLALIAAGAAKLAAAL